MNEGDFSNAQVFVQFNNLTRFESSVFKPILQQMESNSGSTAFLIANGSMSNIYRNVFVYLLMKLTNPFWPDPYNCDKDPCHLAWIIQDHPELLKVIRGEGMQCDTGMPIKELVESNKNFFKRCDRDEL